MGLGAAMYLILSISVALTVLRVNPSPAFLWGR